MPAKKVPAKKAAPKKVAPKKAVAKKAAKKKVAKKTNIELLTAAGVIRAEHVEKLNHKVINKLTAPEVKTLIKLRSKLGAAAPSDDGVSPNFPV